MSSRTLMRFHGTCVSRANSAKYASHFPESSNGRAARAGAAIPMHSAIVSAIAMDLRVIVEDHAGYTRVASKADGKFSLLTRPNSREIVRHPDEYR